MRTIQTFSFRLFLGVVLCILGSRCAVPVFSELQSAKTLDKGKVEITPGYSALWSGGGDYNEGSGWDRVQDNFGFQLGVGLSERIDMRMRYEYLRGLGGAGEVCNTLGIGVKGALVPEWLSLYVPVGLALEYGESWQIHPTLLFTVPAAKWIEINTAAKYLYTFSPDYDNYGAFNVGLGLSTDLDRWVLRPEYGVLLGASDHSKAYHFSLGLTIYPMGRKAEARSVKP